MNHFDAETIAALTVALSVYDSAAEDPVTAPAAFGIACIVLQEMIDLNLRAAALLLDVALEARSMH